MRISDWSSDVCSSDLGITTSGTPHLGNFAGAIRPAIAASTRPDVDAFFFLADYHALIKCYDPGRINRSRLEIAATWIAAGLDSRSEEHTSELQSPMRTLSDVFCLKKKKISNDTLQPN